MFSSDPCNEIYAALAKAQADIREAVKDRQGYGYRYADLAAVLQIVRPALTAQGIAVLQDTWTAETGIGVATRLAHSSGQWVESSPLILPVEAKKGLSQAQCAGSVVTYARRYSLAAMVGLTQEDDDAAGHDDKPKAATITEEQLGVLRDLIVATERVEAEVAKANGVANLADLPAGKFAYVRGILEKRLEKK